MSLDRATQNRSRSNEVSQRFQEFQRVAGDRWAGGGDERFGAGGFGSGRFGSGGFRGRR